MVGYSIDCQPHGTDYTISATVRYNEILFGTMTLPTAFPHSAQHNGQSSDRSKMQVPAGNHKEADTDALTEALRQSFQATVEEAVPDSLMDLINKLK